MAPLPSMPDALAWSADGTTIAAAGSGNQTVIHIVDVAKASVTTTFKTSGSLKSVAISPDGKWLAVGTSESAYQIVNGQIARDPNPPPGELTLFDLSTFAKKFSAKASERDSGFIDLAWAADGKALFAIDGAEDGKSKNRIRHWAVPSFAEHEAIQAPQNGKYYAL